MRKLKRSELLEMYPELRCGMDFQSVLTLFGSGVMAFLLGIEISILFDIIFN